MPFERFRRKTWKSRNFAPNTFIFFIGNIFEEDDNFDGGGSRTWNASYDDLTANDWEWFEEEAWYE